MPKYEYRNLRKPSIRTDLTALDEQRIVIVGTRYDGKSLTIDERVSGSVPDAIDLLAGSTEIWEIYSDGVHAYDLWSYAVDSGTIFIAGTTEVFGDVIQFGFGGPGGAPNKIAKALGAAFRRTKKAAAKKAGGLTR